MDESNPWQTLTSAPVYNNPWICLREDKVIQPDGKPGIYGVINFKNKAIGVVPIDQQGNIHLVGQFRYALDSYSWEIPEGGCPENEDPLRAAQRELQEETGLIASKWQFLGKSHLSNSVTDEVALFYLATELTQDIASPEGTEKLNHKTVPFLEAVQMVLRGEITDAVSMLAIMYCALQPEIKALTHF